MVADTEPSQSVDDLSLLMRFGLSGIELLMLDDLWTKGVESGDTSAASIGHRMEALIGDLLEQSSPVSELIRHHRAALNAGWPELSERFALSTQEKEALEGYFAEYGGLGNTGDALADGLARSLSEEAESLSAKILEMEMRGQSEGDLSRLKKIMVGVLVVCAALIPVIAAGAVLIGPMTAAGAFVLGLQQVASIGAAVAAGVLIQPDPPSSAAPVTT